VKRAGSKIGVDKSKEQLDLPCAESKSSVAASEVEKERLLERIFRGYSAGLPGSVPWYTSAIFVCHQLCWCFICGSTQKLNDEA
jgi:hypothetical protein